MSAVGWLAPQPLLQLRTAALRQCSFPDLPVAHLSCWSPSNFFGEGATVLLHGPAAERAASRRARGSWVSPGVVIHSFLIAASFRRAKNLRRLLFRSGSEHIRSRTRHRGFCSSEDVLNSSSIPGNFHRLLLVARPLSSSQRSRRLLLVRVAA